MDKDRIAGAAKTQAGRLKEAAGKAIGDQKMAVEGKIEKNVGKLQNAAGGLRDEARKQEKDAERNH